MGALASQFWFLAFAIASAASVRTLALVEVLFAQAIARFIFKQAMRPREVLGVVLIVLGVALLLWAYRGASGVLRHARTRNDRNRARALHCERAEPRRPDS